MPSSSAFLTEKANAWRENASGGFIGGTPMSAPPSSPPGLSSSAVHQQRDSIHSQPICVQTQQQQQQQSAMENSMMNMLFHSSPSQSAAPGNSNEGNHSSAFSSSSSDGAFLSSSSLGVGGEGPQGSAIGVDNRLDGLQMYNSAGGGRSTSEKFAAREGNSYGGWDDTLPNGNGGGAGRGSGGDTRWGSAVDTLTGSEALSSTASNHLKFSDCASGAGVNLSFLDGGSSPRVVGDSSKSAALVGEGTPFEGTPLHQRAALYAQSVTNSNAQTGGIQNSMEGVGNVIGRQQQLEQTNTPQYRSLHSSHHSHSSPSLTDDRQLHHAIGGLSLNDSSSFHRVSHQRQQPQEQQHRQHYTLQFHRQSSTPQSNAGSNPSLNSSKAAGGSQSGMMW